MEYLKANRGFGTIAVVAGIALIVVVGGIAYFNMQPEEKIMKEVAEDMIKEGEDMIREGEDMMHEGEEMMDKSNNMENGETMEDEVSLADVERMPYTGERIAGNGEAPLLEYNETDYKIAEQNGDLIVMFFYANWCPICKIEFPKMSNAFEELDVDGVVGFRVNYKDNETTNAEKEIARKFGVGYQHTKVLVKNGERIIKAPEMWSKEEYLKNIIDNL